MYMLHGCMVQYARVLLYCHSIVGSYTDHPELVQGQGENSAVIEGHTTLFQSILLSLASDQTGGAGECSVMYYKCILYACMYEMYALLLCMYVLCTCADGSTYCKCIQFLSFTCTPLKRVPAASGTTPTDAPTWWQRWDYNSIYRSTTNH